MLTKSPLLIKKGQSDPFSSNRFRSKYSCHNPYEKNRDNSADRYNNNTSYLKQKHDLYRSKHEVKQKKPLINEKKSLYEMSPITYTSRVHDETITSPQHKNDKLSKSIVDNTPYEGPFSLLKKGGNHVEVKPSKYCNSKNQKHQNSSFTDRKQYNNISKTKIQWKTLKKKFQDNEEILTELNKLSRSKSKKQSQISETKSNRSKSPLSRMRLQQSPLKFKKLITELTLGQPDTPKFEQKNSKISASSKETKQQQQKFDQTKTNKFKYSSIFNNTNISKSFMEGNKSKKLFSDRNPLKKSFNLSRSKVLNEFTHLKTLTITDFQLVKKLGKGQFGDVYFAIHHKTNCIYALKQLSKNQIKNQLLEDQVVLQIKLQTYLSHQNVLKSFGCFDDTDHVYLILEYIQGGSLFQTLRKKKKFTTNQIKKYLRQIIEGVKYLHDKGIAHRDIKPQNILISNDVCKLCDFSWSTICNNRRTTYCGTFDYAAPQILLGQDYDSSVDLWCLGVLTYEMATGKLPFYHINRKQTMNKIINVNQKSLYFPSYLTSQVIDFIKNLLKKNPSERLNTQKLLLHPFLKQMV